MVSKSFFSKLRDRAFDRGSLLCVGLDPHPGDLAEPGAEGARDFCLKLIEATRELALAYKPNIAFFEYWGAAGWQALQQVLDAIPDEIPVVLDAKRGDIASTADAYAHIIFDTLNVDAVTLNPYLGHDSLEPFLSKPGKGIFLLCKTSNPGAGDLQDLRLQEDGLFVYEKVAEMAQAWNRDDNLGLVVGATHPQALRRVRAVAPRLWFLSPGVGAQGGDLETMLEAGSQADGSGLLIPVSRGISRAANPRKAAETLVERMRAQMHKSTVLDHKKSVLEPEAATRYPEKNTRCSPQLQRIADGLLESGCFRFGSFTLKSGIQSPFYIDLRRLSSFPGLLREVASAYASLLDDLDYEHLAALPYAAMPIGTAISLLTGKSMVYPRKEVKAYGTRASVEGAFNAGDRAVVIDDLATTGGSKLEGIRKLEDAGLQVKDVIVLINRGSEAAESLAQSGYRLQAVITIETLLDHWEATGQIEDKQVQAVRVFLNGA